MAIKGKAEARIPLRVEDKQARDAIKAFNRDFKASLGEINAATALLGKGFRLASAAVREVAQGLEWGVKAALKAEGAAGLFGRRLVDAKKATDDLAVAIGKTVTQSQTWNALVDVAKTFTETMSEFFRSSDGQKWVENFGRALASVLSVAAKATRGLLATVTRPKSVAVSGLNIWGKALEWGLEKTGIANDPIGREFYNATVGTRQEMLKGEFGAPNESGADQAIARLQADLDRIARGEYKAGAPKTKRVPGKKSTRTLDQAMEGLAGIGDASIEIAEEKRAAAERLEAQQKFVAEENRIAILGLKQQEAAAKQQAEINERKRADQDNYLAQQDEFISELRTQTAALAAGGITAAAAAFGQGENVLQALGTFAGGTVQTIGQLLVQLGTAGLAAGSLGTVIPILAPLTGGPVGVAASIAAIAVGAGMVAGGAALAKRSSGGARTSVSVSSTYGATNGGGSGSSASGYSSAYGIGGGAPGMATMRVTNVYLGQGVVVAPSPSEAGRQIQGFLRAAEARGY